MRIKDVLVHLPDSIAPPKKRISSSVQLALKAMKDENSKLNVKEKMIISANFLSGHKKVCKIMCNEKCSSSESVCAEEEAKYEEEIIHNLKVDNVSFNSRKKPYDPN